MTTTPAATAAALKVADSAMVEMGLPTGGIMLDSGYPHWYICHLKGTTPTVPLPVQASRFCTSIALAILIDAHDMAASPATACENGNNVVIDERLCNMNLPNLVMMDCDDQQQEQTSSSLPGNHLTNPSSSAVGTGPGLARDSCPSYAAALASLRTKPLDRGVSKGQGGAGPFPPATTNRELGEVNAMLTEACSRLLDAVQNPDTQYRDLCIQQARKALLVGQHVYRNGVLGAAGCGSSLQSLAANVILDPSWKLPPSPTDVAVNHHHHQQQQQQSPTTAVAASAASYDDYTSTAASNSLPRFDPTAAPLNLTLPTTADMSDVSSKMKALQPMNTEDHRYDTLYGTDSFLGSGVGGTPMHGGSNSNHKKRQKSYGAPTGVWKNPYGFVSTIYVNKRRVYGPLRKSVEAATRDREALVGVKDIITTVEDMRAFVRDMLKPNGHGGVSLSRHATTTDVCMNSMPNMGAAATSTTPRSSGPLPTYPPGRRRRSRSNKKQQVATLFPSSSSSSQSYLNPSSDPTHHSDQVFITI
ncbi:Intraflagellar transport protein 56 [Perkinsus olseni]|uniref:Intraflagellar transport protein 56 n=1 Tax=Perkinsus olseni TaxID=32597 RepID=A0A7J6PUJ2_PEROL|nr:Intraflagellar transport protein 56 [Perkinsus olseni]